MARAFKPTKERTALEVLGEHAELVGLKPHAGPSYVVSLVIDDEARSVNYSYLPFAKTLRDAYKLVNGIPQAECVIRRAGEMRGYLKTNWRGEVVEVEVLVARPWGILVSTINPQWSAFEN